MATTLKGYDPVTVQPWLERVMVAMTLFALCTTCLRIYSRRLNHQNLWWDDYLAIFSMVRIDMNPDLLPIAVSRDISSRQVRQGPELF